MPKSLKVVHIRDLNGVSFNIPGYQRGYRWETKHVKALLKDILEFDSSNEPFYCLQPLVVVKNKALSIDNGQTVYDVIDGQQRLTTLYLILHCIQSSLDYKIRYDRLESSNSRCYKSDGILDFKQLCNLNHEQKSKFADYFYLSQAIGDIQGWLEEEKSFVSDPARIIGDCISPARYKPSNYLTDDIDDPNKELKDVRFIWYEADNEDVQASNDSTTAIATFRRLNHGKTPLTAAELIKALLFQCDLYPDDLHSLMKEIAFRRSTEWNNMEISLQNPFFWNMICPAEYDKPSHIDLILSFVAQDLLTEMPKESVKTLESDADYDYQVFDKYLHNGIEVKEIGEQYKNKVEYIWNKIHDCFAVFNNWYEDRRIYHYIGLLVTLTNGNGKFHVNFLRGLKLEYEKSTHSQFINYLKSEIAKKVRLDEKTKIEELNYLENWKQIVNILMVFNVEKTLEREPEGRRFSFDFCRKMTPSLEHIHPQHLSEDNISFETLCEWYQDKRAAITQSVQIELLEKLSESMSTLDTYLKKESGEKNYKEHFEECRRAIYDIDIYFDTLAEIDEVALHNISNMALIDKQTNSALGNRMMDGKRAKLYERAKLYDTSNHKEGAYIMVGTWMVFNKEFSDDVHSMKFWEPTDRDNYMNAIIDVYTNYISLLI